MVPVRAKLKEQPKKAGKLGILSSIRSTTSIKTDILPSYYILTIICTYKDSKGALITIFHPSPPTNCLHLPPNKFLSSKNRRTGPSTLLHRLKEGPIWTLPSIIDTRIACLTPCLIITLTMFQQKHSKAKKFGIESSLQMHIDHSKKVEILGIKFWMWDWTKIKKITKEWDHTTMKINLGAIVMKTDRQQQTIIAL